MPDIERDTCATHLRNALAAMQLYQEQLQATEQPPESTLDLISACLDATARIQQVVRAVVLLDPGGIRPIYQPTEHARRLFVVQSLNSARSELLGCALAISAMGKYYQPRRVLELWGWSVRRLVTALREVEANGWGGVQ